MRTNDLSRKLILDFSGFALMLRQMQCAPEFVVFQSYENNLGL